MIWIFFFFVVLREFQSMVSASDNSSLLSDQDTNQFWCRRVLNLRSLIQPSETLLVELTETHTNDMTWFLFLFIAWYDSKIWGGLTTIFTSYISCNVNNLHFIKGFLKILGGHGPPPLCVAPPLLVSTRFLILVKT